MMVCEFGTSFFHDGTYVSFVLIYIYSMMVFELSLDLLMACEFGTGLFQDGKSDWNSSMNIYSMMVFEFGTGLVHDLLRFWYLSIHSSR